MLSVLEYLDRAGSSPFANFSNIKSVAAYSSTESISDQGIASTLAKTAVVILLGGGTKKRQDRDIATAHDRWADYKTRTIEEK